MNNGGDIVGCIARIWRMYKKQELLLRSVMSLDTSYKLRKICSHGYLTTVLFKKDVGNIYDSMKSSLDDGELGSITVIGPDPDQISKDQRTVFSEIAMRHESLLKEYTHLLRAMDDEGEIALSCRGHIDKLTLLRDSLVTELEKMPKQDEKQLVSVA
ncbi:MAG TPA: hypothetical protein VGN64_07005 [Dyadobacter sp.]|nr:hypothetical protein [Dyadobacter sp.]